MKSASKKVQPPNYTEAEKLCRKRSQLPVKSKINSKCAETPPSAALEKNKSKNSLSASKVPVRLGTKPTMQSDHMMSQNKKKREISSKLQVIDDHKIKKSYFSSGSATSLHSFEKNVGLKKASKGYDSRTKILPALTPEEKYKAKLLAGTTILRNRNLPSKNISKEISKSDLKLNVHHISKETKKYIPKARHELEPLSKKKKITMNSHPNDLNKIKDKFDDLILVDESSKCSDLNIPVSENVSKTLSGNSVNIPVASSHEPKKDISCKNILSRKVSKEPFVDLVNIALAPSHEQKNDTDCKNTPVSKSLSEGFSVNSVNIYVAQSHEQKKDMNSKNVHVSRNVSGDSFVKLANISAALPHEPKTDTSCKNIPVRKKVSEESFVKFVNIPVAPSHEQKNDTSCKNSPVYVNASEEFFVKSANIPVAQSPERKKDTSCKKKEMEALSRDKKLYSIAENWSDNQKSGADIIKNSTIKNIPVSRSLSEGFSVKSFNISLAQSHEKKKDMNSKNVPVSRNVSGETFVKFANIPVALPHEPKTEKSCKNIPVSKKVSEKSAVNFLNIPVAPSHEQKNGTSCKNSPVSRNVSEESFVKSTNIPVAQSPERKKDASYTKKEMEALSLDRKSNSIAENRSGNQKSGADKNFTIKNIPVSKCLSEGFSVKSVNTSVAQSHEQKKDMNSKNVPISKNISKESFVKSTNIPVPQSAERKKDTSCEKKEIEPLSLDRISYSIEENQSDNQKSGVDIIKNSTAFPETSPQNQQNKSLKLSLDNNPEDDKHTLYSVFSSDSDPFADREHETLPLNHQVEIDNNIDINLQTQNDRDCNSEVKDLCQEKFMEFSPSFIPVECTLKCVQEDSTPSQNLTPTAMETNIKAPTNLLTRKSLLLKAANAKIKQLTKDFLKKLNEEGEESSRSRLNTPTQSGPNVNGSNYSNALKCNKKRLSNVKKRRMKNINNEVFSKNEMKYNCNQDHENTSNSSDSPRTNMYLEYYDKMLRSSPTRSKIPCLLQNSPRTSLEVDINSKELEKVTETLTGLKPDNEIHQNMGMKPDLREDVSECGRGGSYYAHYLAGFLTFSIISIIIMYVYI